MQSERSGSQERTYEQTAGRLREVKRVDVRASIVVGGGKSQQLQKHIM